MSKKIVSTMRAFSAGQINRGAMRRDESDEYRTGALVMSDWRIEETETLVPRPGRRLLALTGCPRVEYVRLGSIDYAIGFSAGQVSIFNLATAATIAVNDDPGYGWTNATVAQIYFCVADTQIVLCFPGFAPVLIFYTPLPASFTFGPFAFRTITSQSQQPFYRSGYLGATMGYSAVTGAVTLTCSQAYFTAASVGMILSIVGQQVTIQSVQSPTQATASVAYRLHDSLSVTVADVSPFAVGQIVEDSGAAFKMEVSSVSGTSGAGTVVGVLTSSVSGAAVAATAADKLVSPLGASPITSAVAAQQSGTTAQWLEQFMGTGIGWPMACAFDKGRLIFFDFRRNRRRFYGRRSAPTTRSGSTVARRRCSRTPARTLTTRSWSSFRRARGCDTCSARATSSCSPTRGSITSRSRAPRR